MEQLLLIESRRNKKKPKKTNPVHILVEVWKDIEGVREKGDSYIKMWDKEYFSRHAYWCKKIINVVGTPPHAAECMEELAVYFRKKNLSYTISTVHKWAEKWATGKIR